MRVLFVVPYVPNLIRVRPYNLIRHLSARGHQVTVLTLWSSQAELEDARVLEAGCHQVIALPLTRGRAFWNCLRALASRLPLQARYCWQPELYETLRTLTGLSEKRNAFDVIHIEHLRGAEFGMALLTELQGHRRPPVVWDSVDCISHLFRQTARQSESRRGRLMAKMELGRTSRYEATAILRFDRVLVTSETDRHALLALGKQGIPTTRSSELEGRVRVLPNGVDLAYFHPLDAACRKPATLVISGKMSYHANVTMALYILREVMPLVWDQRPDVELEIVGKDPPRAIVEYAAHPRVSVTGTVGEIRPYLQHATIALAPIQYGAGIQNKVLEAMACGAPVIATPQAVSALQGVPGQDYLTAESPGEMASTILTMLDNPQRQLAIGQAGRRYVERCHHWTVVAGQLEEHYMAAAQSVWTNDSSGMVWPVTDPITQ